MYVALPEWLALMETEYLRTYLPEGGAAVKCLVVPGPREALDLSQGLENLATELNYQYARIDASHTRIHMIEQLFFALSQSINWQDLIAGYLRRLLENDGFILPGGGARLTYADVAYQNTLAESEVRRRVRSLLNDHLSADYAMAREFRIAMLVLCQAQLDSGPSESAQAEAVLAWLHGALRLISALKFARIFQKIGRNNARDIFLSLAHWLRLMGKQGLVLVLDIGRYLGDRRSLDADGGLFYSLSATTDAYEVIRQFIDATDELESCLIAVVAPTVFLQDERRGLASYNALKLRVWDEVRDRRLANPLSGLVRLQVVETQAG